MRHDDVSLLNELPKRWHLIFRYVSSQTDAEGSITSKVSSQPPAEDAECGAFRFVHFAATNDKQGHLLRKTKIMDYRRIGYLPPHQQLASHQLAPTFAHGHRRMSASTLSGLVCSGDGLGERRPFATPGIDLGEGNLCPTITTAGQKRVDRAQGNNGHASRKQLKHAHQQSHGCPVSRPKTDQNFTIPCRNWDPSALPSALPPMVCPQTTTSQLHLSAHVSRPSFSRIDAFISEPSALQGTMAPLPAFAPQPLDGSLFRNNGASPGMLQQLQSLQEFDSSRDPLWERALLIARQQVLEEASRARIFAQLNLPPSRVLPEVRPGAGVSGSNTESFEMLQSDFLISQNINSGQLPGTSNLRLNSLSPERVAPSPSTATVSEEPPRRPLFVLMAHPDYHDDHRVTQKVTPPRPLYLPQDSVVLSDFHCLARKNIEAFETTQIEVDAGARGRNVPIVCGQVGIRCRFCTHLPIKERARGSAYYPSTLRGVYQTAINMIAIHLMDSCTHVPIEIMEDLIELKKKPMPRGGSGPAYWARTLSMLGVAETENRGLKFQE